MEPSCYLLHAARHRERKNRRELNNESNTLQSLIHFLYFTLNIERPTSQPLLLSDKQKSGNFQESGAWKMEDLSILCLFLFPRRWLMLFCSFTPALVHVLHNVDRAAADWGWSKQLDGWWWKLGSRSRGRGGWWISGKSFTSSGLNVEKILSKQWF